MGRQVAALEHVLCIEVRTLAIRRGDGVQDRQFLRGITLVQEIQARMQSERTTERQRRARA